MMTVTEYKAHVQEIKNKMLENAKKSNYPKTDIALVTVGANWEQLVKHMADVLKDLGYTIHLYHYDNNIDFDIGLEVADLRQQYEHVWRFDDRADNRFAFSAYSVAWDLVEPSGAQSFTVFGNDNQVAAPFANQLIRLGRRVITLPFGQEPVYSSIFDSQVTFIFDRRYKVNCYPIYTPVFKLYSWNTINDENRQVYDLEEEVILRMVEDYVCR